MSSRQDFDLLDFVLEDDLVGEIPSVESAGGSFNGSQELFSECFSDSDDLVAIIDSVIQDTAQNVDSARKSQRTDQFCPKTTSHFNAPLIAIVNSMLRRKTTANFADSKSVCPRE